LFVAIRLPFDRRAELTGLGNGMPGARWLTEDQVHLTLAFLGSLHGFQSQALHDALSSVKAQPFELQVKGAGHFPPRGRPKVIWAGIGNSQPLMTLQSRVVAALRKADFKLQRRRFRPHVTLARLNGASSERVAEFLQGVAGLRQEPFQVSHFHVYSSHLRSEGADYHLEATYPLGD
jgi:2'-5' RNA ligase